ncbi:hypothetical protein FOZ62_002906 [Perkinsus olseni]|uniref:Uncharacterized protein n=1 Tax=Perkinsus olseni TaxID=32597 RepID=A0A7J6QHA3_PEROL|nr:hypothetical protein FOZ62_002906 [Perkinsus olseni]
MSHHFHGSSPAEFLIPSEGRRTSDMRFDSSTERDEQAATQAADKNANTSKRRGSFDDFKDDRRSPVDEIRKADLTDPYARRDARNRKELIAGALGDVRAFVIARSAEAQSDDTQVPSSSEEEMKMKTDDKHDGEDHASIPR